MKSLGKEGKVIAANRKKLPLGYQFEVLEDYSLKDGTYEVVGKRYTAINGIVMYPCKRRMSTLIVCIPADYIEAFK